MLEGLRRVNYKNLEDMVYRMVLTYEDIFDKFDIKYIAGSTLGYTLTPSKNRVSVFNSMLKSLVPNEVKKNLTIDDTRPRSKLTTNETRRFFMKSFSNTILNFYNLFQELYPILIDSFKSYQEPTKLKNI